MPPVRSPAPIPPTPDAAPAPAPGTAPPAPAATAARLKPDGLSFHHPFALRIGTAAIVAGVLAHMPMFATGAHTGYEMVGMPVDATMLTGMAMIPLDATMLS